MNDRTHCPFGTGALSEGEIITNAEQDRLIAKRAWLQLWSYLMRHDERIKATRLQIPWSLEEDHEIHAKIAEANNSLRRFASVEDFAEFNKRHFSNQDDPSLWNGDFVGFMLDGFLHWPRKAWVFNQVLSSNPLTVLDVGAGVGDFAIKIAERGIQVTALCVSDDEPHVLQEHVKDKNLPIQWLHGRVEDFPTDRGRFDVVLCCEVLEHVADDYQVLRRCADLAEKLLVVTTPVGSIDLGFHPNSNWRTNDHHVRAYSQGHFEHLLGRIEGFEIAVPVRQEKLQNFGHYGSTAYSFCATLRRVHANDPEVSAIRRPALAR